MIDASITVNCINIVDGKGNVKIQIDGENGIIVFTKSGSVSIYIGEEGIQLLPDPQTNGEKSCFITSDCISIENKENSDSTLITSDALLIQNKTKNEKTSIYPSFICYEDESGKNFTP